MSSFVADMSTGYSGNMGYPMPANWAFDQILEFQLVYSEGILRTGGLKVEGI